MSVRHAILGLLAQRSRHGYELRSAFEAVAGGAQNWDVKPAQIYATTARLEKSGLIVEDRTERDGGPEKHIYAITAAGHQALEAWFASGTERDHQRDEFFIKLMIGLVSGVADPYQLIRTQRTHLYEELHGITVQRSRADPRSELAKILLMDQAAMHLEADLHWLDMAEVRIDDVMRQPLPEPEARARGRPKRNPE